MLFNGPLLNWRRWQFASRPTRRRPLLLPNCKTYNLLALARHEEWLLPKDALVDRVPGVWLRVTHRHRTLGYLSCTPEISLQAFTGMRGLRHSLPERTPDQRRPVTRSLCLLRPLAHSQWRFSGVTRPLGLPAEPRTLGQSSSIGTPRTLASHSPRPSKPSGIWSSSADFPRV